jgi:hypothetical protein
MASSNYPYGKHAIEMLRELKRQNRIYDNPYDVCDSFVSYLNLFIFFSSPPPFLKFATVVNYISDYHMQSESMRKVINETKGLFELISKDIAEFRRHLLPLLLPPKVAVDFLLLFYLNAGTQMESWNQKCNPAFCSSTTPFSETSSAPLPTCTCVSMHC